MMYLNLAKPGRQTNTRDENRCCFARNLACCGFYVTPGIEAVRVPSLLERCGAIQQRTAGHAQLATIASCAGGRLATGNIGSLIGATTSVAKTPLDMQPFGCLLFRPWMKSSKRWPMRQGGRCWTGFTPTTDR